jgi:GTP-binding protein
MFVDEATILCSAGSGGKGCQSLDRTNPRRPRANGGDGGDGGSIYIEARPNIQTLLDFQLNREFTADKGKNGSSADQTGACAEDTTLGVPAGTEIFDKRTGELLKDLDVIGARVLVCRGGAAGKGNDKRNLATEGEPGEQKELQLKLKLIADIGLVGFPNAGKSTFISRVSNARSKVAAYPFTTKNPILGVLKFNDEESRVIADIPGLIEGAHAGRGMGIDFLKHVERTRILLHIIDFAAFDGRDPVSDYHAINAELSSYSPLLAEKKQIVVANKIDVPEARENLKAFRKKVKVELYPISAATGEGFPELLAHLRTATAAR